MGRHQKYSAIDVVRHVNDHPGISHKRLYLTFWGAVKEAVALGLIENRSKNSWVSYFVTGVGYRVIGEENSRNARIEVWRQQEAEAKRQEARDYEEALRTWEEQQEAERQAVEMERKAAEIRRRAIGACQVASILRKPRTQCSGVVAKRVIQSPVAGWRQAVGGRAEVVLCTNHMAEARMLGWREIRT